MEQVIKFGIGFVTGRPNVSKVINNTYERLINQFKDSDKKVELTIFILFDLGYQFTTRIDFYGIIPNVYKDIKVKYITPEDMEEEKKKLIGREILTKQETELFFGHGHAKGRNTLMYYAQKSGMDYLLFWDDDEYPVAVIKDEKTNELTWKEQDNIAMHLKYIENADVTIGYHCGYISPIPYMELNEEVDENIFKEYIEAISNEVVSWDSIKQKFIEDNGVTFANPETADGKGSYEIQLQGDGKWVVGSTLCLNLNHIEKIPAFYNPIGARGEDAFFSTKLGRGKAVLSKMGAGFLITTVLYWSVVLLFGFIVLAVLGFGGGGCAVQTGLSNWNSIYNITYFQDYLLSTFGGYIGSLFIVTLAMLVSAKTHSTVFAITIPFILTCVPPFVGRLEAFARIMTLFPDQLLSINKNLEDFSLYHIGGNIYGGITVIVPLYLILFCFVFPILFFVYHRTQIK